MKKLYRVLLAEDNLTAAKVVIHSLERYNFAVTHVEDGRAALLKVRSYDYELIITDLMMPVIDGLQFAEKLLELKKNIPIIMLTAAGDKDNVIRAAKLRINFYLLKPITPILLIEKVKEVLKIDDSQLIDKKLNPFQASYNYSGNDFTVNIIGTPTKKQIEEFLPELFINMNKNKEGNVSKVEFDIHESFGYMPDFLDQINEIASRITKSTRIVPQGIVFKGSLFGNVNSKNVGEFATLALCKIIYPTEKRE